MIRITDTISIDEAELTESFVRASGPGGQNVNKVSSAVQLRFDARHSPSLPNDVAVRLMRLAGKRVTKEGVIVIIAQQHRTQERNREDARERLFDLIRQAAVKPAKPATSAQPGTGTTSVASFDAAQIESEIVQLQQALDRGRDKLDPKTVQVLEENLRIIRKATEDARHALEQDPANRDLLQYFAGSVQSKLELVRRATQLAGV